MNKFSWVYSSDEGRHYKIGLLHGPQSGHMVVYCNTNIVLIDFEILETKSFSFFIEEELCHLHIEAKEVGGFAYGFEIDKEVDTPLNRKRRKLSRVDFIKGLVFVGSLVVLLFGILFSYNYYQTHKDDSARAALSAGKGVKTIAIVYPGEKKTRYTFTANGKVYVNFIDSHLIKDAPIPLAKGDEFSLLYIKSNPELSKIHFNKPTEKQVKTYLERAYKTQNKANKDQAQKANQCLVDYVYETQKIKGLGHLIHQQATPEESANFNKITYQKLVDDENFQEGLKARCSEHF